METLKYLHSINKEKLSSFAPFPIRLVAGIAFIFHGLPKFGNLGGTQGFFGNAGIPPEMAIIVALLEVLGGIALILGVLTRITSILFIIEMIGATIMVKASTGFLTNGGYELDLLLMSIAISLLISGPGRLSIERDILKREIFPKIKYSKEKEVVVIR
jgi:putative oxidoreductase